MITVVERNDRILVGARAHLIEDNRELAWAERFVRNDPDIKWILGNFVEAEQANDNGHIFKLDDLQSAQHSIANKPLNMIHHANYIVGAYVSAEMVYPTGEDQEGDANPIIEALAAFWRNNFPEEYALVQRAHAEGSLYYSMEALPETLTCPQGDCTEVAYAGRTSDTYCGHMNALGGAKVLNRPRFIAGALILPPVRPGWSRADISELSLLMEQNADQVERIYAGLEKDMPHLEAKTWEAMMQQIVVQAFADPATPIPAKARKRVTAAGLISKEAAHYRPASGTDDPDGDEGGDDNGEMDRCGTCANGMFLQGKDSKGDVVTVSGCQLVQGIIDPMDVCDLYSDAPNEIESHSWPSYDNQVSGKAEVAKSYSAEERKKMAQSGEALPDGSYPIKNVADLENAIQAYGRGGNKAKVKAHIKKRAKQLNAEGSLPEGW